LKKQSPSVHFFVLYATESCFGKADVIWTEFFHCKSRPQKNTCHPWGQWANDHKLHGQENDHKLHGFVPELHILVGLTPKWAFFNSIALYQNCTFWSG
jgi:hypothetical protein